MIMLRNRALIALLMAVTVGLSACVPPPPRHTVVYHEGAPPNGYYQSAPPPQAGPYQAPPPDTGRYCHSCGTVRSVDQVAIQQGTTGGGAVLGAIIGGLVGNQFGGGSGKAAMTAAGVVGGAVAGNAIESNNAQAHSGYAWSFRVQLDDGQWATVNQVANPGFHPGDRVAIRGDHLEWLR
jgi:outer membrane lipoprotein SlyB